MLSLAFSETSLEVQRKVVCEEFKEHYINKPYGDAWKNIRNLAYEVHPYQWMTIGKELKHVEDAQLQDVKNFFFKHYRPINAIVVVAGNVKTANVLQLAEKWFGGIEAGEKYVRNYASEPKQKSARRKNMQADVPLDAFYKTWHMAGRLDNDYYSTDLVTDILSNGASSRLYQSLVKEKQLFSNLDCHHFGSVEPGLVAIEGKLVKGVTLEKAEAAVNEEIAKMKSEKISDKELEKVKNKTESTIAFEDMSVMNRANSLAFYELLGDASLMNKELAKYHEVTAEDMRSLSETLFDENNSNTLYYERNK
jgi:zinc protease